MWRNTTIELLSGGHPGSDDLTISGSFIAVGVFKHHSGMIPSTQPSDGFAYVVIIPDQSFASFAALASKVTHTSADTSAPLRRCRSKRAAHAWGAGAAAAAPE